MDKQGFREALDLARSNKQLGVWEVSESGSLLAVWDDASETVVALDEDHTLPILASDRDINLQWRKHRGMSGKPGRLIVVDPERCRALLVQLQNEKV